MFFVGGSVLVLRKNGSRTKKRTKEEEKSKGDYGPPTRKVFWRDFCRTWTKRWLWGGGMVCPANAFHSRPRGESASFGSSLRKFKKKNGLVSSQIGIEHSSPCVPSNKTKPWPSFSHSRWLYTQQQSWNSSPSSNRFIVVFNKTIAGRRRSRTLLVLNGLHSPGYW